MELSGKVIAVLPAKSGVSARTGNNWMTQQYVIEIPGQYPKKMVFEVFGEDRIKQFNILVNAEITVQFDIDASEYNGKWYNSIRAYNVVHGQPTQQSAAPAHAAAPAPQNPPQQAAAPAPATSPFPPTQEQGDGEGSADDLPFDHGAYGR